MKRHSIARRQRTHGWGRMLSGMVAFACVFLLASVWRRPFVVASSAAPGQVAAGSILQYLSPLAMQLSPDGHWLYVVCQDADRVLAVDTRTRQVARQVRVGHRPQGIALSPDGGTLYVSSEWDDSVTEIDAESLRPRRTLATGAGPVGVTTDRAGKVLFVANTLGDDISLIDLATGSEIKRLDAGHFPEYVALSRDGSHIYVTNLLVRGPYNQPPTSELTVVDTARQNVTARVAIPGVIQLRHITELPASAGGGLLVPFMRPKNLNPLVQVQQGWYLTHGIAVVRPASSDAKGPQRFQVSEVLLDDVDRYYADGFGAAATPDGRWALVTASGANIVSIVDTAKLNQVLRHASPSQPEALADRLDLARQFVVQRLRTGRNPTAVVVSPDSRYAYIANRMDDTISVVDLGTMQMAPAIDLGGPRVVTRLRHGERLFFDASYCYQGQMACATCHPHVGLSDGLAWSLETPQLGRDVVENKTLLGVDGTSPFKWNGKNPDLETQDGPRSAHYIFRSQGFGPKEVKDLADFILSLRLPPSPHLARDGQLTEAQARGRAIFYRTRTNTGALIPPQDRCYFCHAPVSHYTSRVLMDVGTATPYDTIHAFDVPQLEGAAMKPPYLHNGEAGSLEEIWTKFNPEDKHGITSDMDKVQLNDLIEYLKTL
ncbi:MAG: cytochrome c peroxidase [Acidobacteriaceae bacterium]